MIPDVWAPWPLLLAKTARHERTWGSVLDNPVMKVPCEIVLSCKPRTNGRELNVRCLCQAGTAGPPSRGFYCYDVLGTADSLESAKALWRQHRDSRPGPGCEQRQ